MELTNSYETLVSGHTASLTCS